MICEEQILADISKTNHLERTRHLTNLEYLKKRIEAVKQ